MFRLQCIMNAKHVLKHHVGDFGQLLSLLNNFGMFTVPFRLLKGQDEVAFAGLMHVSVANGFVEKFNIAFDTHQALIVTSLEFDDVKHACGFYTTGMKQSVQLVVFQRTSSTTLLWDVLKCFLTSK